MNDEKKEKRQNYGFTVELNGKIKPAFEKITAAYEKGAMKNPAAGIFLSGKAVIELITPLLHTATAFLFSGTSVIFGVRPFGIALLAASGKHILWSYVGALLSSVISSASPLIDIAVYTLIMCLRRLISVMIGENRSLFDFNDGIRIKMAVSLIGAVAAGAYSAFAGDFTLYSLGAFLLYIALVPIFTFLYIWRTSSDGDSMRAIFCEVGYAAVAFTFLMSVRGIAVLSLNLSVICGLVMAVLAVHKYGILKGSLFGLLLGFSGPAELVPIFSVSAAVSGIFLSTSPYLAVISAMLSSVSWAVYAGGYLGAAEVGGSVLVGGVILAIAVFAGAFDSAKDSMREAEVEIPKEAAIRIERERERETSAFLSSSASAFEGLADMLYRLSDKLRTPSIYDIKEAVLKGKRGVCRKCRRRDKCYTDNAAEVSDAWDKMASVLHRNGVITESETPDYIEENCPSPTQVTDGVNGAYSELLKDLIDTDKTEVMAFDYNAIAMVLRDVISQREGEYDVSAELSKKLYKKLTDEGIEIGRACVFGKRIKTVFIENIRLSGLSVGEDDLRRLTSKALGGEFSSPTFEVRGNSVNATLTSAESYSLRFDKAQSTMEESSASGDVAVGFPARGNRFCALISDGMGSGREAAITSGMCALFIEKMMSAGNSAQVTLKMLNAMIRAKGAECSATVDLLDYDLITGEARFIKSGAAPSFIVRGNEVYKVESKTVPVGIIRALDAELTTVKTEIGDIIVMISDGVAESDDDAAWLYSLLADAADRRAAEMTERIIREAERRFQKKDDATVCIIRVAPPRASAAM